MFIDPVAAWQCSQLAREDEHCHMDEESRLSGMGILGKHHQLSKKSMRFHLPASPS
jgi:hypothetical protein